VCEGHHTKRQPADRHIAMAWAADKWGGIEAASSRVTCDGFRSTERGAQIATFPAWSATAASPRRGRARSSAFKCRGKWPDQTLDGGGQHLASLLQEGRENANIDLETLG
jgi:hypothetical protein